MDKLKGKEDERLAAVVATANKKDKTKEKKAKDTTSHVTIGSENLKRLEQLCLNEPKP